MYKPFTRLKANVKSTTDIQLGPCTAVCGYNQQGKTSILDTVRLALTGKHPIGPHAQDLQELVPPGDDRMDAVLMGPQGQAHFRLEIANGKAKKPQEPTFTGDLEDLTPIDRSRLLALDNIGEMLRYGNDRMREALMRRFGEATEVPTPLGLNVAQQKLWEEGKAACAKPEVADQLAEMAKWFRSKARAWSKDAKALEDAIERRQNELDGLEGAELLPALQAQLEKAEAYERTAGLRAKREDLQAQLQTVQTRIAEVRAQAPQANVLTLSEDTLADTQAERTEAQRKLDVAKQLQALLRQFDGANCPMCGTHGVNLTAISTEISKAEEHHTKRIAACDTKLEQYRQQQQQQEVTDRQVRELESRQASIQAQLTGLADVVAPDYNGKSTIELRQQIEKLKQAELMRRKLFADSEDMHRLRERSDTCKVLERETAKVLKNLLKNVQDTAEKTVNKYMPEHIRAALVISDKAVEWRVMGSDGRPHKRGGMSGVEFGALVVAVACAWEDEAPLRMLLLDDVDFGPFDRANFQAILGAIKDAQARGDITQAIISWNRPDEIPADWHKVEVSARP